MITEHDKIIFFEKLISNEKNNYTHLCIIEDFLHKTEISDSRKIDFLTEISSKKLKFIEHVV